MASILRNKRAEAAAGTWPGAGQRTWGGGRESEGGMSGPVPWFFGSIFGIIRFFLKWIAVPLLTVIIIWYIVIMVRTPVASAESPLLAFIKDIPLAVVSVSSNWVKWVACQSAGNCAVPEVSDDATEYGIRVTSLTPTMSKFREDDEPTVKTRPIAAFLSTQNKNTYATVSGEIEDGTLKSCSPSKISFAELQRGAFVGCTFNPIVSQTASNTKIASLSLTYPFEASATLPVSVIDAATYDGLERFYVRDSVDFTTVESKIAQRYNIDAGQRASSIRAPLVIGAYIDTAQPISQGRGTLVVTVENVGGGTATFDTIVPDTPDGITIISSDEVNLNVVTPETVIRDGIATYNRYFFNKDSVWAMSEEMLPGDFKSFTFDFVTTGAEAKASWRDAYHGRIYLQATYTYNTRAETMVSVSTCEELNTCDTGGTAEVS